MATIDVLVRLTAPVGISLDWLVMGAGPKYVSERGSGLASHMAGAGFADGNASPTHNDVTFIRRYDVEASAGQGAFNDIEKVVERVPFRTDFLRHRLHADPDSLVLITAKGESMVPTLRAGDMMLVDKSVNRITEQAVYLLVLVGELIVKRVRKTPDGFLVIKSDNPMFGEDILPPEKAGDIQVAGRVLWSTRMVE